MILTHNIRQTMRTPIRSLLFIILLASVNLFLCFGLNMWLSVNESINQVNAAFTTIGVIEHSLPHADAVLVYDFDYSPIISSQHVKLFDRRSFLVGFAETIVVSPDAYRDGNIISIVEFEALESQREGNSVRVRLTEVFHTVNSRLKPGAELPMGSDSDKEFAFEQGKKYIAWLQESLHYGQVSEITEDFFNTEEGKLWLEFAEKLQISLSSFGVYATNDIQSILAFHQRAASLVKGRLFSEDDYSSGSHVCVISASTAGRNNLEVGDKINISFFPEMWGYSPTGLNAWVANHESGEIGSDYYEIVGIYQGHVNMGRQYGIPEDTIFIPQKSIEYRDEPVITGNNLVSFRLGNGSAEAFMAEIEPYIEEHRMSRDGRVFITIYDQGYSKISGALAGMRRTSIMLALVCAGAGLLLITLLAYLLVGKQKRAIAIMYSLGVNRIRSLAFLLVSVLLVAGLAVALGGMTGYFLSDFVLDKVYSNSLEAAEADNTYSDFYGTDNEIEYQIARPPSWKAPRVSGGVVLLLTQVVGGLFAAVILRAEPIQILSTKEA